MTHDPLYQIAQQATDEVFGRGAYARMNHGYPDPGVQNAIRNTPHDPTIIQAAKDARDVLATILRESDETTRRTMYITNLPDWLADQARTALAQLEAAIPAPVVAPVSEMSSRELLEHEQAHEARVDAEDAAREEWERREDDIDMGRVRP